jgi:hypothetical protein
VQQGVAAVRRNSTVVFVKPNIRPSTWALRAMIGLSA